MGLINWEDTIDDAIDGELGASKKKKAKAKAKAKAKVKANVVARATPPKHPALVKPKSAPKSRKAKRVERRKKILRGVGAVSTGGLSLAVSKKAPKALRKVGKALAVGATGGIAGAVMLKKAKKKKLVANKARLATHPKRAAVTAIVESRAQARGMEPGVATAMITEPEPDYDEQPEEQDENTEEQEVDETEAEESEPEEEESESEEDSDVELGFVGAVAAAAPAALKAVGKIGKIFKKKKKKKSKITQMPLTTIEGSLPAKVAATTASVVSAAKNAIANTSATDNQSLINAVVAAVPGPVRDVVLEALKSQQQSGISKEATMDAIAGQVDESLKPQIAAMLAALQSKQLQEQATYEHESLVADAKFRDSTVRGLQTMLDKLDRVEARLSTSAVVPQTRIPVFGSRNILEGR